MTSADGTKNTPAATTHKLIEEVPLCAAAATQRGPKTVAILKSNTSQKPMAFGSCLMGSGGFPPVAWLTESRPARESTRPACGSCAETDRSNPQSLPTTRNKRRVLPAKKQLS